jgi:hypothetical protein
LKESERERERKREREKESNLYPHGTYHVVMDTQVNFCILGICFMHEFDK